MSKFITTVDTFLLKGPDPDSEKLGRIPRGTTFDGEREGIGTFIKTLIATVSPEVGFVRYFGVATLFTVPDLTPEYFDAFCGLVTQAARETGADRDYLMAVAYDNTENLTNFGGSPSIKAGPFQFTEHSWRSAIYGSAANAGFTAEDRFDWRRQPKIAAILAKDATDTFKAAFDRTPTFDELYFLQLLGGDALAALKTPERRAKDVISYNPPAGTYAAELMTGNLTVGGALTQLRERLEAAYAKALQVIDRQPPEIRNFRGSQPSRVLQADMFTIRDGEAIKNTQPFVIGLSHRVEAFIGPPGGGDLQAGERFPDERLDWPNADRFTLGVIFSESNQWDAPQTSELVLSRYGMSTRCRFDFTPTKVGPFRARLTVHYRGRVLQTALLKSRVERDREVAAEADATPRLSVETQIHGNLTTLDDRRRFDVSLVLNRTVDDLPTMQVAGREGAFISSLVEIEQQLEKISARLRDVANDAKRYSKGLESKDCTDMLIGLATEGRELYGRLVGDYIGRSAAAKELRESEYLQIVATKPDAVVPLELVYQYEPPADDAKVCPKHLEALAKGRCPADCDIQTSPAPHVCPMGFWGLSKVIERHIHDPSLGAEAFVEAVEPIGVRSAIPLKGAALLAASNNVAAPDLQKLEKAVVKEWQLSGTVKPVGKWTEWKQAISDVRPTLLVALPHSSGVGTDISLEISGDTLKTRFINKDYLRPTQDDPPPLVLLMGCDVAGAGAAKAYTSHVANFRRGGAPVILGTLAIVEGGNAATVTGVFVEQLVKVLSRRPDRFGEVLRETKRQAIRKGLLMVLGLVGFGDADWQLKL